MFEFDDDDEVAAAYLSPNPCQTTRGKCVDASLCVLKVDSGCCTGEAVARFTEIASAKAR